MSKVWFITGAGRGIGAALVSELCATFDGEDRVGWLETDKERNVRFYSALGFEVSARHTVLDVDTWYMRRDPRRGPRQVQRLFEMTGVLDRFRFEAQ